MERLNVVTAGSRLNLLNSVNESLSLLEDFEVLWYLVLDSRYIQENQINPNYNYLTHLGSVDNGDFGGAYQKNHALDQINDGWVYFLDDDNTIHPAFGPILSNAIKDNPAANCFVFDQELPNLSIRRVPDPYTVRIAGIDLAQYVFKRSIIGDSKFPLGTRACDYYFYNSIRDKDDCVIIRIPVVCTYYNFLKR
jgi:hypothetical protein